MLDMALTGFTLVLRTNSDVTVKGKTDTNGYPFEGVNRSLSVRHPFERLKKNPFKAFDKPFERFAYPFAIH